MGINIYSLLSAILFLLIYLSFFFLIVLIFHCNFLYFFFNGEKRFHDKQKKKTPFEDFFNEEIRELLSVCVASSTLAYAFEVVPSFSLIFNAGILEDSIAETFTFPPSAIPIVVSFCNAVEDSFLDSFSIERATRIMENFSNNKKIL